MIDIKSILKIFGLFILIFSGLFGFASMDGVEKYLGQQFIKSATSFYDVTMSKAWINAEHHRDPKQFNPNHVWVSPAEKEFVEKQIRDAHAQGKDLKLVNEASIMFNIGVFPKTALVFLLSLILATPMAWKKKLKALIISLLAFMVYFYVFIYFELMFHIAKSKIGVYELEGFAMTFVYYVKKTFCNFGFSLTFSIIVWAATSVDFNALFDQFNNVLKVNTAPVQSNTAKRLKKSKKKKTK